MSNSYINPVRRLLPPNLPNSAMSATMLPPHYDSPLGGLYDGAHAPPKPKFMFKMPRVVPDQKAKFESEELFRRLARESEVRYTGYRDRPLEERKQRFQSGIREGHVEIAFLTNGTNINLMFSGGSETFTKDVDYTKEHGKVHLRSPFILNGVCVRWRGWLDLDRLDGVGCLEYDEETASEEDRRLREEIEKYKCRIREFEEKQRAFNRVSHHGPGHPIAGHGTDANIQVR